MTTADDYRLIFPDVGGRKTRTPNWMKKPGPPWQLRDVPCGQREALFDLPEAERGLTRTQHQERHYQIARAARWCNGAPGYDEPCPFREECKLWALSTGAHGVYGGVLVTAKMITDHKKEVARAAEEARAPENESGELAERRRKAV